MRTVETPTRRNRRARAMRREDKRWAAKSGPVTVRRVDPTSLRQTGDRLPVTSQD